jgi:hypothetical protein
MPEKAFFIYSKNTLNPLFYGIVCAQDAQRAIEQAPFILDLFPENASEIIAIAAGEYQPYEYVYAIMAVDLEGNVLRSLGRVVALNDEEAFAQAHQQFCSKLMPGEFLQKESVHKKEARQRVQFITSSIDVDE